MGSDRYNLENSSLNGVTIENKEFRKIFRHLCIAAKRQKGIEKKNRELLELERKTISEKIDAVERNHPEGDAWIKNKLHPKKQKIIVVREKITPTNKSEINELKKHFLEIKKSYETLRKKKNVSKEKIKAIKERMDRIEKILRTYQK